MSKNIHNLIDDALAAINIRRVLETFEPSTMQAETLKRKLLESTSNATVSATMYAYTALKEMAAYDKGAMQTFDALHEKVSEHAFNLKLAYCFEAVQQSPFKMQIVNKLDKLSGMQIDEARALIRSGYLNDVRATNSVINVLIEDATLSQNNTTQSTEHVTYIPNVVEHSGTMYVKLKGRSYAITESDTREMREFTPKIEYLTSVLANTIVEGTTMRVDESSTGCGTFTVDTETGVFSYNNTAKQGWCEYKAHIKFMAESLRNDGAYSQASKLRKIADSVKALYENASMIDAADNILVVEKLASNETFMFVKHASDNIDVCIVSSRMCPNVVENFKSPADAVEFLKRRSGYDASEFVSEELAIDANRKNAASQRIAEQLEIVNMIQSKVNEIKQKLEDTRVNDSQNTNKLQKLNEALQYAEALLIEQKSVLAELTK